MVSAEWVGYIQNIHGDIAVCLWYARLTAMNGIDHVILKVRLLLSRDVRLVARWMRTCVHDIPDLTTNSQYCDLDAASGRRRHASSSIEANLVHSNVRVYLL